MNPLLQSLRLVVIVPAMILANPALFSQDVLAQSVSSAESCAVISSSPSVPHTQEPGNHLETSVSLGSVAQLTASRISDSSTALTTQSLAPSAGLFAAFRQSFRPWFGYSVNLGYTQTTYRQTVSALSSSTRGTSTTFIPAHMYEISVSYIAQKRFTNHFALFGEAGGGTVAFAAKNNGGNLPNRSNAFRPEAIAGFGVDYRLAHGLGLRAQYRGLFIRYPYPDDGFSPRLKTIISQPTLSLTYRFGSRIHR